MHYSYIVDDGPTFEIHPEPHNFWGIYGNGQHIINSNAPDSCIQMVLHMNAIPEDFPDELHQYGQLLPPLGKWKLIKE